MSGGHSNETTSGDHSAEGGASRPSDALRRLERWLLVGTPLSLGAVLWFHPRGGEELYGAFGPVADAWLLTHVLLLPLFGLLGVCLFVLLRGYVGPVAAIGRLGVAIYLVFYVAFEAIAGLATGLLLREARSLPAAQREGVTAAVRGIAEPTLVLGLAGTGGAVLAVVAIAVLLRRSGAPLAPVALLGGVPLAVVGHGGTRLDALGTLLFLCGVVWLDLDRRRRDDPPETAIGDG